MKINQNIAIIPARGGSKRIPRKNIYPIDGQPMLAHTLNIVKKTNLFSRIVVSSDDQEILSLAEQNGAEGIKRPDNLATDEAFEVDVYKDLLEKLSDKPDFFCGIYPTAIFLSPDDIFNSYKLLEQAPKADIVMGVSSYPIHPYKALLESGEGYLQMLYPHECLQRSQTYPTMLASNGTFYWCRTNTFLDKPAYYVEKLKGFEIPADRALDIDTIEDLHRAEFLYKLKQENKIRD